MARGDTDENGQPTDSPDTGTPDPTEPANVITREQVIAWYMKYQGREPESEDIINGWLHNPHPEAVEAAIRDSPEAKAYAAAQAKKTATPPPPDKKTTGGSLIDPFGEIFKQPDWTPTPDAPTFKAPDYKPPPKFEAPTYADVQNETGYAFARDEGMRAIEHSKAAGGIYNSPGTLKDLSRFTTGLADQTYGNVFNRKAQTYEENYKTQYADPYKNAYTSAWDTFNSLLSPWQTNAQSIQRKNEFDYKSAWDAYQFDYKKWTDRINESKDLTGM